MSIRYVPPSKHVGQITQFHRSTAGGSLQARLTLPCRAVACIVQKLFARAVFWIDPVEARAGTLASVRLRVPQWTFKALCTPLPRLEESVGT